MDRQNKNGVVLERVEEGTIMPELIMKLTGPLAEKELPVEGCSRRNGKRDEGSRQKKSDDRQHYDKNDCMKIRKERLRRG